MKKLTTCSALLLNDQTIQHFIFSGFSHHLGSPELFFLSSTLSCPIRPSSTFNPHFPDLLQVFRLVFCIYQSSSFLLTCPYHFRLFSVTFFVTGATLTDPPSVVTPHIHFSILIAFTSSLFSWLFFVAHVSAPYTNAGCSEIFELF